MKKITKIMMAGLLSVMLLASCGNSQQNTEEQGTGDANADGMKKVGVIQLVEHEALDNSYKGFVEGLKESGYTENENVTIDFNNAQGDQSNTTTIAQKLKNDNPNLIFAIATPAAQAVANQTAEIPIVVTAVTDPKVAGLVDTNEAPGGNVTGTSDLTPVEDQIKLIKDILPEATRLGVMYTSSEDNSILQAEMARTAGEAAGFEITEYTVSKTEDIMAVAQSAIGNVDVIYIPTDNLLAANMPAVSQITTPAKIPLIVGEKGMMEQGGLATKGIDYFELGKQTGAMAGRILDGENPGDMPIEYQEESVLYVNQAVADELGITLPQEILDQAK